MSNVRFIPLVGAALLTLASPVFAQDADRVVASVNGSEITLGHMIAVQQRLPEQYRDLPDDVLFEGILEQLIQQTALTGQTSEPTKRTQLILDNERRALIAGEVIETAAQEKINEAELQAAYDAAYGDAVSGTEYLASHILVETEEEAQALVSELEDGADFAELAREKSTGPSGPNGGELGWFGEGMMVKPFEDAVKTLEVSEISPPVQTQFGWHVLILTDKRDKAAPAMEDVRGELSDGLRQTAIQDMIKEVVESAEVDRPDSSDIDPSVLRDDDLIAN